MDELLALLAEADPELVDTLLTYGMTGPEGKLLDTRYKQGTLKAQTKMPELIESRGMNVTPSPLAYMASALAQIQGGNEQEAALQQQQANLLRRFPAIHGLIRHQQKMKEKAAAEEAARIAQGEADSAAGDNTAPVLDPAGQIPQGDPYFGDALRKGMPKKTQGFVPPQPLGPPPPPNMSPNPGRVQGILDLLPYGYNPFDGTNVAPGGMPWTRRKSGG